MKIKRILCGIFLLLTWFGASAATLPDSSVISQKNQMVTMPDSVKLATDVYLPGSNPPFPCILVRTPYNKDGVQSAAQDFAKNGCAVIVQDTRGKFASEGVFYAFQHERADGLATLAWLRKQPWCNGKVAGWGGSYVGYTQWAISDFLDVLLPDFTSADLYDLIYPGGLFSLATAFSWGLVVDAKTVNPIPPDKIIASFRILPLSAADDSVKPNQFLDDWLRHPQRDEYWESLNQRGPVAAPVLAIAGWYDIFLLALLNDLDAFQENGHPENHVVIGPWAHGKMAVELDFGKATGQRGQLQRRFIQKHLQGEAVEVIQPPFKANKYSLFIMQRNEYFGCDEWPPKAVKFRSLFLASNQSLAPVAPATTSCLKYTYDPRNPYPNLGGTFLGAGVGPAWQNPNTGRTDQLIFETGPLDTALVLLGPLSATLFVRTDAPGTDFIACLQDVYPDGKILNIQEGGASVKMDPRSQNRVRKLDFSLWATGYQVQPGHKLRVAIVSGWFPRFARNLNDGKPIFDAQSPREAHQEVFCGLQYPSHILLPILPLH